MKLIKCWTFSAEANERKNKAKNKRKILTFNVLILHFRCGRSQNTNFNNTEANERKKKVSDD